ncbi:MAG: TIGR00725 family protein [Candidatus Rokuibacteriota bacterium]
MVGAGEADAELSALAEGVGRALARRGAVLVCGGLGGVMEAACRGAALEGGLTVGILPGTDRGEANEFVQLAIPTGMGEMRNALIVRSVDSLVAIAGEFGTLSEMAFALKTGVPVVGLRAWELAKQGAEVDAFARAHDAEEAVARALELARSRRRVQ